MLPTELLVEFWKLVESQLKGFLGTTWNVEMLSLFKIWAELVRNLCVQTPTNQEAVGDTSICRVVDELCRDLYRMQQSELVVATSRMAVQMLSNVMTENRSVQRALWPYFAHSPLIGLSLRSQDDKTQRSALVWIYNCTHHDHEQSLLLLKFPNGLGVLGLVLEICEKLVDHQQDLNFELGIAIITAVIEIDSLPLLYRALRGGDGPKVTLLKIMDGLCHASMESKTPFVYTNTSLFLIDLLDESIEHAVAEHQSSQDSGRIASLKLYYILQFWKLVSEQPLPEYSRQWAEHGLASTLTKSLGILNRVLPAAINLKNTPPAGTADHPLFMLKSDLIKTISNLSFHYAEYKELFQTAIPLVLANCSVDDMNPYIRETSLFCIRNLVTGSSANQDLVASMEAKGAAPSPVVEELGFHVSMNEETKKVKIERKPGI
ncbi:Ataxin-10 [Kappamyces sp. JEL0829]|nr:Ataxin-10 [Kappamyces sp. JEL0829]